MALECIYAIDVRVICFGHGPPLLQGCNAALQRSLEIVRKGCKPGCPRS